MQDRITVCLEEDDRTKIETCIKQEYPRIKTVSALTRIALHDFLKRAALDDLLNQDCDMNLHQGVTLK
jgi:hypothetical protein